MRASGLPGDFPFFVKNRDANALVSSFAALSHLASQVVPENTLMGRSVDCGGKHGEGRKRQLLYHVPLQAVAGFDKRYLNPVWQSHCT